MSEEDRTQGATPSGETATSGTEGQTNNTSTASEGVNTQETSSRRDERIAQLIRERDEAKAEVAKLRPAETKSIQPLQGSDDEWKRKIELEMAVPTFLKEKVSDMTSYWKENPRMSKEDVYKVFTPTDVLVKQAQEANDAANSSRTGGTSNPAARQESLDVKSMSDAELKTELEARIARGEKV